MRCLRFVTLPLLAAAMAACDSGTSIDPVPSDDDFTLAADSIEISAPGEARILISIADTASDPTVTWAGPVTASIETSGTSPHRRRVLVVEGTAAGSSVVSLGSGRVVRDLKVTATPVSFTTLAVTYGFGCGIATDGRAWCWGDNLDYQIGSLNTTPKCMGDVCQYGNGGSARLPLPVRGDKKFVSLSVSGDLCGEVIVIGACGSSCGLTTQGEVYCWGSGFASQGPIQFGSELRLASVRTTLSGTPTPKVCGLTATGEAYCLSRTTSVRVGGSLTFTSFAIAREHSCGVSSGSVYCWGSNVRGELGILTTDSEDHPDPVKAVTNTTFTLVVADAIGETCALGTDKKIYCWGEGDGTPRMLGGESAYESLAMSPEGGECGLTASGIAECWSGFMSPEPVAVQSPVAFTSIGVGGFRTASGSPLGMSCGLSATGDAYCWDIHFIAAKLY